MLNAVKKNPEEGPAQSTTCAHTQTTACMVLPLPSGPPGSQPTIPLSPGTLTVEQIYQDRDQFAKLVREVAAPDVGRMGIEILSFTIKVMGAAPLWVFGPFVPVPKDDSPFPPRTCMTKWTI